MSWALMELRTALSHMQAEGGGKTSCNEGHAAFLNFLPFWLIFSLPSLI